jgi:hypothetical protein
MFPHERSLVQRMADKRFALIGVNSDSDREECKKKNKDQQVTWRSFWDGEALKSGPIAKAWEVHGWPTLYLIDHKGVIRRKFLGNPGDADMDRLIDELVERAEKDTAP